MGLCWSEVAIGILIRNDKKWIQLREARVLCQSREKERTGIPLCFEFAPPGIAERGESAYDFIGCAHRRYMGTADMSIIIIERQGEWACHSLRATGPAVDRRNG